MAASFARSLSLDRTQGTAQRHVPSHACGAARGSENGHLAAPTGRVGGWCTLTSEAAGGRVEVRLRAFDKRLSLELGIPSDANLRKLHLVLQGDGDQGAEQAAEQVVRVLRQGHRLQDLSYPPTRVQNLRLSLAERRELSRRVPAAAIQDRVHSRTRRQTHVGSCRCVP